MGLKIRRGTIKDFPGALAIGRGMYREGLSDPNFGDYRFFKPTPRAKRKKWFATLIKDVKKKDAVYFVADLDGRVVGHCFVRRETPGSELSHVGVLGINVDKDHRNMRIGSKLLDAAIGASKGMFEILHLHVFSTNYIAKNLYKSRGFKSFGVGPRFIKRGNRYIDREYMYLDL
jgi:ribosomal protein S18 acetylase RimI-like enzyme